MSYLRGSSGKGRTKFYVYPDPAHEDFLIITTKPFLLYPNDEYLVPGREIDLSTRRKTPTKKVTPKNEYRNYRMGKDKNKRQQ